MPTGPMKTCATCKKKRPCSRMATRFLSCPRLLAELSVAADFIAADFYDLRNRILPIFTPRALLPLSLLVARHLLPSTDCEQIPITIIVTVNPRGFHGHHFRGQPGASEN